MAHRDAIKELIGGRTVMMVFPGPSVAKLKEYIDEISSYDVCWFGTHKFPYVERDILKPAGLEFDIIAYGPVHYEEEAVAEFLDRKRKTFF